MNCSRYRVFHVAVALFAVMGVASIASAASKISSPEPTFDFGEVDNSEDVLHDFVITNEGDSALNIGNVKTSCGCTVAELKKKVLDPGESTVVSAKFSLKGKTGQQKKVITVESDDPENPRFPLQLQGLAVAAVTIEPNLVNFGRVADDEVHEQIVDILASKADLSFNITSVETPSDRIETELKTLEAGKHYQLAVRSKVGIGEGTLTSKITMLTDNPQHASLQVSVFGSILGDLSVSPAQLTVSYSEESTATSAQYLRVTPGSVKSFEITEVVVPIDSMVATIKPRSENDYLIHVQNMPLSEALDGKDLIIKTNVPTSPEIRIPFRVIKRSGNAASRRQIIPQISAPAQKPSAGN